MCVCAYMCVCVHMCVPVLVPVCVSVCVRVRDGVVPLPLQQGDAPPPAAG